MRDFRSQSYALLHLLNASLTFLEIKVLTNLNGSLFMAKQFSFRMAFTVVALSLTIAMGTPLKLFAQDPCDCYSGGGQKQDVTNSGTQFMLCFEQNLDPNVTGSLDDGYLEIYLATLSDSATVTITCKQYPNLNKVFSLAANSSVVYRLTTDTPPGVSDSLSDIWITSSEQPDDRVVQVVSTAPVVCYGMNYKSLSADAFLALPVSSAGTDYRILSYPNSGGDTPSQFAVAAFSDSTHVTITPSAPTRETHASGVPFTVLLNRGQAVQVQTDPTITGLDLTGSQVQADKPVAVYGGEAKTEVPSGNGGSRDLLLEAMPPVDAWGKVFVLSALDIDAAGNKGSAGDLMRVLALNANTTVTVNGNPWTTLGANQWADSLIQGPVIVEASQPVLVGEYEHTSTGALGDPSLAVVPSVDQTFNDYTFFASTDPHFSLHKVIIATDIAAQSSIVFDNGTAIPASVFTPILVSSTGRKFAITEYQVQPGIHTLHTNLPPEQGFTILMYGLGSVISYGYAAGLLLKPLTTLQLNPLPTTYGGRHSNEIDFHNTTNAAVYLDSAVFTPDLNADRQFRIHSQENVATDIGRLAVGEGTAIHLISEQRLVKMPVSGTLRIYSHTPQWHDILPSETPYTLYPDAVAGVSNGEQMALSISNYPNPFSMFTTISFSLPASGDLSIVLYDELGRVVRTISSGEYSAGPYSIRFERGNLPSGFYTCQIVSDKLHIKERVEMVAAE